LINTFQSRYRGATYRGNVSLDQPETEFPDMKMFFTNLIAALALAATATTALATDPVPTPPAPTPSWTSPDWVVTARPGTGTTEWGRVTSDTRLQTTNRVVGDSLAIRSSGATLTRDEGAAYAVLSEDNHVRGDTRLGFDGCSGAADCGESGFDLLARVGSRVAADLVRSVEGRGGSIGVDAQLTSQQRGTASADAVLERGRFQTYTRSE